MLSDYVWATARPDDRLEHVRVGQPAGAGVIELVLYVLAADPVEAARLARRLAERMTRTVRALIGMRVMCVQSVNSLKMPDAL